MQTGVTVLMWVEKPWSTRLPVRSCFSQVCTPQKQNPSDPELQPVRNVHSAQLTLTLKVVVSHEGLQTQFWGQNRRRGHRSLAVMTHAGSMREATGMAMPGKDIPEGLWQSTDIPGSEFIKKTYNF